MSFPRSENKLTKEVFINILMSYMDTSMFKSALLTSKTWNTWLKDPAFWNKGMKFFGFSDEQLKSPVYHDIATQQKICLRLAKLEKNSPQFFQWLQDNIIATNINFAPLWFPSNVEKADWQTQGDNEHLYTELFFSCVIGNIDFIKTYEKEIGIAKDTYSEMLQCAYRASNKQSIDYIETKIDPKTIKHAKEEALLVCQDLQILKNSDTAKNLEIRDAFLNNNVVLANFLIEELKQNPNINMKRNVHSSTPQAIMKFGNLDLLQLLIESINSKLLYTRFDFQLLPAALEHATEPKIIHWLVNPKNKQYNLQAETKDLNDTSLMLLSTFFLIKAVENPLLINFINDPSVTNLTAFSTEEMEVISNITAVFGKPASFDTLDTSQKNQLIHAALMTKHYPLARELIKILKNSTLEDLTFDDYYKNDNLNVVKFLNEYKFVPRHELLSDLLCKCGPLNLPRLAVLNEMIKTTPELTDYLMEAQVGYRIPKITNQLLELHKRTDQHEKDDSYSPREENSRESSHSEEKNTSFRRNIR